MRAAALRPAAARSSASACDRMLAVGWGLAAVLGAVAGLMTSRRRPPADADAADPALRLRGGRARRPREPGRRGRRRPRLGVFLNLVGQYVRFVTSELRLPFAFAVLLAVLLVKPSGLFGRKTVRRV